MNDQNLRVSPCDAFNIGDVDLIIKDLCVSKTS